jgi:hypothetical protein
MFRKITVLGLFATGALALAVPDAQAVYINGKWVAKGVEESGKVWYDTVFAGTNPPNVNSQVFGVTCNPGAAPLCTLTPDGTVFGTLSCTQKVCITNPDKPQCRVPGGAQGTPYQLLQDYFSLTVATTQCLVKGSKGTCKVLAYDNILNADLGDTKACPSGFVADFVPDPFIGRTSTCDVSRGSLVADANGVLTCSGDGQPATSLCQLVSGNPGTIGEPYLNQTEIPNDGTIITAGEYAQLACTPNVLRAQ